MDEAAFGTLRAGFGVREITPPIGVPNSLGVTCMVEEIWDPLLAVALVLEDDDTRAVIVGLDLCGLAEQLHTRIRNAVARAVDCDPDAVVLNVSHTHSAPYISTELDHLIRPFGLRNTDDAYVVQLERAVVEAARKAALVPLAVRVGHGRAPVERVGANRRPKRADGTTIHRPGRPPDQADRDLPEGLIDPDVAVLSFVDDGGPAGCIFSYSCHPTAAGGDLHGWVSADFVGPARERIQPRVSDMPALFLQGCGGNVGTGKYVASTPREDVAAMGARLGSSAVRALEAATASPAALGPLQVIRSSVELEFDPFPTLGEMLRQIATAATSDLGDVSRAGEAFVVAGRAEAFAWAAVTVIAFGDVAIVALPGEVFVEHGIRIRESSPFPVTVVTAYNDNSLQYIPTASAFPEGAYEVDGGWRYIRPGMGERLADHAIAVLSDAWADPAGGR